MRPYHADAQSASLREKRRSRYLRATPARPPHLGSSPRRGGLRTPVKMAMPSPKHCPLGPPGVRLPRMIMLCLSLRSAPTPGRGDRVPPRKPPFGPSPGLPPQAHPSSDNPPAGGAGSARPQRWQCLHRRITPLGRPAFYAPMIMLSLGLRPGRIRGRAERVPPRKSPLA